MPRLGTQLRTEVNVAAVCRDPDRQVRRPPLPSLDEDLVPPHDVLNHTENLAASRLGVFDVSEALRRDDKRCLASFLHWGCGKRGPGLS